MMPLIICTAKAIPRHPCLQRAERDSPIEGRFPWMVWKDSGNGHRRGEDSQKASNRSQPTAVLSEPSSLFEQRVSGRASNEYYRAGGKCEAVTPRRACRAQDEKRGGTKCRNREAAGDGESNPVDQLFRLPNDTSHELDPPDRSKRRPRASTPPPRP